jgi:leucyl aminopeptidase
VTTRRFAPSDAALARADAAIFVLDNGDARGGLKSLPQSAMWLALHRAVKRTSPTPVLVSRLANRRHTLVVVGFTKAGASGFERLDLAGRLAREALKPGVRSLQIHQVGLAAADQVGVLEAQLSGVLAAAAPLPEQKSKPTPHCDLRQIEVNSAAEAPFARAEAVAAGNHLARWLTALPPNVLDCVAYRKALQVLARREGWSFRFYDVPTLKRLGAGAFLAVAQANPHRGAGILRLTYRPRGRRGGERIALVGKGICFDTGGINLKPHRSMYAMHGDMQGSAVAVGTLLALSRLGSPHTIDCWLALTENQIGPLSYRPQDVVKAVNGVTIQVVHSDAEGRMALADTLALASRDKPSFMIDFATLTGACVNALTERYSGAFTNRAGLHEWLQATGRTSGERVWCFPMDADFDVELESQVADVMQCTLDNKGDHILAARFLSRFVGDTVPWVHVDLSSSERKGGLAHVPSEFTGFGVRYATHLLDDAPRLRERLGKARP